MTTSYPFAERAWCVWLLVAGLLASPALAQPPSDGGAAQPADDAPSAPAPKATFYGFVQTHYRHSVLTGSDAVDAPNFRVQRVRLGVRGDLYPWLSYEVEIDPRSPDANVGLLRDAFLAIKVIPRHQIRVGQQKTQFGFENRESSSELFQVNRTELSESLGRGVNLRDIGVGLIGNVRLGKGWRFEDAITVVNGDGLNAQADSTRRKNVFGRVGLRYRADAADLTMRVGVSGATGDELDTGDPLDPSDDSRLTFDRLGTDVQIDDRRFFLSAEHARGTQANTLTGETDEVSGYYVNLVGKTRWRIGPSLRLDTLGDDFRRWTFGTYYGLPNAPFRLLVNYEFRELRDGARVDDKFYVQAQVRLR